MLLWIPVTIIGVYLALMFYIYFNQDKMVFYPTDDFAVQPDQLGLIFEDVHIKIDDNITIHGWYFPSKDPDNKKAVLFFHGNAGNISHRLETAKYLYDLGVATFMFDYRGYGYSTGEPTEDGVYADGEVSFDWLVETKSFKAENIILFGRSLGGAVAVELAGRKQCGGLIIESSFTSVGDIGQKLFPIFPIRSLIRYTFNSVEKIGQIQIPKLITHSPDDELIPYTMGQKLFEAAAEPKQFIKLSGGHNSRSYFKDPEYKKALLWLLNENSANNSTE